MERRGFLQSLTGIAAWLGIGRKAEARKLFAETCKPGPSVTCKSCGWAGEANLLNPQIGPKDEEGGRALDWHFDKIPKCGKCGHDARKS